MLIAAPCVCVKMRNIGTELSVLISLSVTCAFLSSHFCPHKRVFLENRLFFFAESLKVSGLQYMVLVLRASRLYSVRHACLVWLVTAWLKLTISSALSAGLKLRAPHIRSGFQGEEEWWHLQRCNRTFLGSSCHPSRSVFLSDVTADDGGTRALPWQPEMMNGSNLI